MKKTIRYLMAIFTIVTFFSPAATAATTSSIAQYDITWTFSEPVEYGQFATGDYWVVGPVSITGITPVSEVLIGTTSYTGFTLGGDNPMERTMNGSMVNPVPNEGCQSFDSEMYAWHVSEKDQTSERIYSTNYDGTKNVAVGVNTSNPLVLQPGSSLVSTVSFEAGWIPQLRSAAILTVLDSVPPNNGATCFRPPYSGSAKPIYSTIGLRKDLLPSYALVENTPLISEMLDEIHRPWLDHYSHIGNGSKYSAPAENQRHYGTDQARIVGMVSLMLMLDEAALVAQQGQNKDELLIHLVQKGIDLHYIAENGGFWWGRGGLSLGRKWPIIFAGLMLDDAYMANIGSRSKNMRFWGFSEDSQTGFLTQEHVDITNGPLWAPSTEAEQLIPVSQSDIGMAEYCEGGFAPDLQPGTVSLNLHITHPYRRLNSPNYLGAVLSALMMDQRDTWNHHPLFEYTDRYIPWAWEYYAEGDTPHGRLVRSYSCEFFKDMWDTYRSGIYYNYAPEVDAGTDQQITFPTNSVSLDATVSDDGEPAPPAATTVNWSKLSGLGTVTFGDASSVDTTASFTHYGVYELQLQASDGDKTGSDTVIITIDPEPGTELLADAGMDQAVTDSDDTGSETVQLDASGSVAPISTIVSYVWSEDGNQIATGVSPNVSFSAGVHTVTLTITDSDGYVDTDVVEITVFLTIVPDSEQLYDGDFENEWNGTQLGADITLPVTVDSSSSSDWETIMVGGWVRQEAGNWNSTPAGTGNDSDYAPALRKIYGTAQSLSNSAIAAGTTISLNWDYHVPAGLSSDTVFTVRLIGVNEAVGGEAVTQMDDFSTTLDDSSTVSGEAGNFDEFFNMEVVISSSDSNNGTWQSATQQQILVEDSWDYIVVIFGRNSGDANNGYIQMDNLSVTICTQPDIAPVADAGPDQSVVDLDESGSEEIQLDGSGSTDSDGTIVSYVWSEGGNQIATGVSPTVTLGVGTHTIALEVTDNNSNTDTDTVEISVLSGANLLNYGDFETVWGDHTHLGSDVTLPLTVDSSSSSDWETIMVGDWVRQEAGNWHIAPAGSGNDSSLTAALRKVYGTAQSMALSQVASGSTLQLDWDYHVPAGLAQDTTFAFRIFGVNEAAAGQVDTVFSNFSTTLNDSTTVTGESGNFQEIFNIELTVSAADSSNGTWQSATPQQISISDSWDYIVVIFGRNAGVANNADIQVDNISVTVYSQLNAIVMAGDADGNGSVNLDDFIILKQNYGITGGAQWNQGDFNGDGNVNLDDFIILKSNYGR